MVTRWPLYHLMVNKTEMFYPKMSIPRKKGGGGRVKDMYQLSLAFFYRKKVCQKPHPVESSVYISLDRSRSRSHGFSWKKSGWGRGGEKF